MNDLLSSAVADHQREFCSAASNVTMSQSPCQLVNDNSDEIVKVLILAHQHRSCMLKQGLDT